MKALIRVEFTALAAGEPWRCTAGPELILVELDQDLFRDFIDEPDICQPIATIIIALTITDECSKGNTAALEWLFAPELAAKIADHPTLAMIAYVLLRSMKKRTKPQLRLVKGDL